MNQNDKIEKSNFCKDEILTIKDVAEYLRVHRSTISRYANSGELKSFKIGSRRLFRLSDVILFFENQVAPECVSGEEV